MPLIKCPDCGKDISSNAVACPECGRPMKAVPTRKNVPTPKGEGCFLQTLNVGCMIVLGIIGLFILLLILTLLTK